MPGATVAITHDNVWCSLLDDNADTFPDSQYLLERMQLKYERSLKEGIISLTPKEIKDRTSAGSKLSTLLERPTLSEDGRHSSSSTIPRPGLGFGRQKAKAALAAAEREGQDPDQTFSSDSASIRTTLPETRGIDSLPAVVAYQAKHQGRLIPKLGPWLLLQKLSMVDGRRTRLGVHRITGLESAVRLIRREKENPSSQLRAVERELRALQTLKHPNIVRLLDVVETDKYIAAMLEYTSGGELIDYIISQTYLKDQEAARLFSQLISGVWYMHQKRVVHRNIKVETLVLDADRNLLITDFDFAHLAENLGDEFLKTSCGAPIYAAPEVVMGEKLYLGGPVDIWACGIVLYGMLAGYLPFDDDPDNPEGENPRLLYKYITTTPVKFPRHVSEATQDLLRKMLAPDPAERITIEGVMEHQWVTSHAPISARPELQESRPGSYFPTAFGYTLEDLEMRAERKYKTRLQHCLMQLKAPAAPKRLLSEDQCSTRGSIKSRATTVRPHTSAGEKERTMASSPLSGVTAVGIDQAMSETSGPHHRQLDVVKDETLEKRRNTLPGLVQGTGGRRKKEGNAAVEGSMEADATELGGRAFEDGQRSPSVHRSSFKWAKKAIKRLKRKE